MSRKGGNQGDKTPRARVKGGESGLSEVRRVIGHKCPTGKKRGIDFAATRVSLSKAATLLATRFDQSEKESKKG